MIAKMNKYTQLPTKKAIKSDKRLNTQIKVDLDYFVALFSIPGFLLNIYQLFDCNATKKPIFANFIDSLSNLYSAELSQSLIGSLINLYSVVVTEFRRCKKLFPENYLHKLSYKSSFLIADLKLRDLADFNIVKEEIETIARKIKSRDYCNFQLTLF